MVEAISSSYDDEEIRIRAVQSAGWVPNASPTISIAAPIGLSPISTLSEAPEKEPVPQHRPSLPAPEKHFMLKVIDAHNKTEQIAARCANVFDADVGRRMAEIERLSAEKQEALEDEAKATKSRDTWETLSTIAQYVAGVGLVTLGFACGGWPGALLIGAGVVGLGNRLVHDTHFIETAVAWYTKSAELQKKIINNIEMGAFMLQMGLGLAGGFGAWYVGAFAAANGMSVAAATKKVASFITSASGVMTAGSRVGVEFYKKRIADFQARMQELNYEITADSNSLTQDASKLNKWLETAQTETEEIQKMIRNTYVSTN